MKGLVALLASVTMLTGCSTIDKQFGFKPIDYSISPQIASPSQEIKFNARFKNSMHSTQDLSLLVERTKYSLVIPFSRFEATTNKNQIIYSGTICEDLAPGNYKVKIRTSIAGSSIMQTIPMGIMPGYAPLIELRDGTTIGEGKLTVK